MIASLKTLCTIYLTQTCHITPAILKTCGTSSDKIEIFRIALEETKCDKICIKRGCSIRIRTSEIQITHDKKIIYRKLKDREHRGFIDNDVLPDNVDIRPIKKAKLIFKDGSKAVVRFK